jgi:hypothetical protein
MNTKILAALAPTVAEAGSTVVKHRLEERELERRREHELELVEARSESEAGSGRREATREAHRPRAGEDTTEGGKRTGDAVSAAVESLSSDEDCGVCRKLLSGIERIDDDERRGYALVEYGRFKQSVGDGASADEIRDELREMDVLDDVLADVFSSPSSLKSDGDKQNP